LNTEGTKNAKKRGEENAKMYEKIAKRRKFIPHVTHEMEIHGFVKGLQDFV
jgi:hypothetical protein